MHSCVACGASAPQLLQLWAGVVQSWSGAAAAGVDRCQAVADGTAVAPSRPSPVAPCLSKLCTAVYCWSLLCTAVHRFSSPSLIVPCHACQCYTKRKAPILNPQPSTLTPPKQENEWEEKWDERYWSAGRAEKSAYKWAKEGPDVWHEKWGETYDGAGEGGAR